MHTETAKTLFERYARLGYTVVALALLIAIVSPVMNVFAYGQVTSRYIEMSSSEAGATATYKISFDASQDQVIEGVVVNFCDNDPLIGDGCTYTSGESADISGATLASVSGTPDTTIGASNWKISANSHSATTGNGVILALTDTNATESGSNVTSGSTVTFEVSGIVNPNYTCATAPNCTFYARVLTYTTDTGATGYQSGTIGSATDAGGMALSTATVINVTVKVQEQLTFCVSGGYVAPAATTAINPFTDSTNSNKDCSANNTEITAPNLNIGHKNASGTIILDNTQVDTTAAYTQTSTNASAGAVVRMKAGNTCPEAGLTASDVTKCPDIPGIGQVIDNTHNTQFDTGTAGEKKLSGGVAAFGLCAVDESSTTVGSSGSTKIAPPYDDSGSSAAACIPTTPFSSQGVAVANVDTYFGMDNSTNGSDANSVISTYGGQVFSTLDASNNAGSVQKVNTALVFAATASLTTPAGIYTGSEALIATGTF